MGKGNKPMLTVRESARRLGVTLDFLYRVLWSGQLAGARKVAKTWRIPAAAVEARRKERQRNAG